MKKYLPFIFQFFVETCLYFSVHAVFQFLSFPGSLVSFLFNVNVSHFSSSLNFSSLIHLFPYLFMYLIHSLLVCPFSSFLPFCASFNLLSLCHFIVHTPLLLVSYIILNIKFTGYLFLDLVYVFFFLLFCLSVSSLCSYVYVSAFTLLISYSPDFFIVKLFPCPISLCC